MHCRDIIEFALHPARIAVAAPSSEMTPTQVVTILSISAPYIEQPVLMDQSHACGPGLPAQGLCASAAQTAANYLRAQEEVQDPACKLTGTSAHHGQYQQLGLCHIQGIMRHHAASHVQAGTALPLLQAVRMQRQTV